MMSKSDSMESLNLEAIRASKESKETSISLSSIQHIINILYVCSFYTTSIWVNLLTYRIWIRCQLSLQIKICTNTMMKVISRHSVDSSIPIVAKGCMSQRWRKTCSIISNITYAVIVCHWPYKIFNVLA